MIVSSDAPPKAIYYRWVGGRRRRQRKKFSVPRPFEWVANLFVVAILILAWAGNPEPGLFVGITGGSLLYFLFGMLRVCNAINTDGSFCSNDAHGFLKGCRSQKRHRIQARWRFVPWKYRPASVQRCFQTKAEQRRRSVAPPLAPTPSMASAASPPTPIVAESLDILALIEVLFAGGSFFLALLQLTMM